MLVMLGMLAKTIVAGKPVRCSNPPARVWISAVYSAWKVPTGVMYWSVPLVADYGVGNNWDEAH